MAEVIVAAASPPAYVRTLTLADLRRTVGVTSPQISPDGRRVVIHVRRNDYGKDRVLTDLVLIDVRSRAARTLLHRVVDLASVQWSPDGSRIAYIAQAPADPDDSDSEPQDQIFVLPMNGGEPAQITREKMGVEDLDWRPDGRAIAYVSRAQAPNQKAIEAHQDQFEVTGEPWTAQSAPTDALLYQVDASGSHRKRVGTAEWNVGGGFAYAADGRSIFVTLVAGGAPPTHYLAREIVRVNVASGAQAPLAKISATQGDPLRAGTGHIAFSFANPRGTMQTEVALAGADGASPRSITFGLDRDVNGAAFLPPRALALYANDRTQRSLFRVGFNGSIARIPIGDLNVNGDQTSSRDGALAFTATAPDHPAELFVLAPGAAAPRRLTGFNTWVEAYHRGKTYAISWKTSDGLQADGVLTAPPSFSSGSRQRFPLVLLIHGGPTAASTTAFSGFAQVLAAHGWFVFQPNYRGSDNLGLRYARTTVPHITSVPGKDIESGLAAVLRAFPVDASRLGVSGWSEGGLMTSWLITHDTRWRAAVSGAAVNDWVQYGDMTDAKDFTKQFIGPSPWTSPAAMRLYQDESPLTFASNVRTPTLILSDSGDFRVPTPLAYEFYHEVRATGTPVQFVIYPVVGHFPSDLVRGEDVFRRWEAWLAKYL